MADSERDVAGDDVDIDGATPEQIARANAAVEANLNADGSLKYGSAQGYACALTAIVQTDAARITGDDVGRLREALIDAAASLAAAVSLLSRGGEAAKKAAPSDKMFDQMLKDYEASLCRARAALTSTSTVAVSEKCIQKSDGAVEGDERLLRLKRELLAAARISKASPFHSAEMQEGVASVVEYLAGVFRLERDDEIRAAIDALTGKGGRNRADAGTGAAGAAERDRAAHSGNRGAASRAEQ